MSELLVVDPDVYTRDSYDMCYELRTSYQSRSIASKFTIQKELYHLSGLAWNQKVEEIRSLISSVVQFP